MLPTSSPNDRYGLFGPLLADFLGHRFSTEFFKRFCIDLGPPNGAKIDKKSAENRYFGVFGAALAFYTPSLAPQDDFFVDFYTCEPSFRRDLTVFLKVFAKSTQSLPDHFSSDF